MNMWIRLNVYFIVHPSSFSFYHHQTHTIQGELPPFVYIAVYSCNYIFIFCILCSIYFCLFHLSEMRFFFKFFSFIIKKSMIFLHQIISNIFFQICDIFLSMPFYAEIHIATCDLYIFIICFFFCLALLFLGLYFLFFIFFGHFFILQLFIHCVRIDSVTLHFIQFNWLQVIDHYTR